MEVDVVDTPPSASVTGVENNTAWPAVAETDDPRTDIEAYTVSDDGTDDPADPGLSQNDHRGSDGDV